MKEQKYKAVRVYEKSGRKVTLEKNLTLEEAKRYVMRHNADSRQMVVYYKQ